MADFDHITANGTTKYCKDSTARSGLTNKVDKVAGKGLSEEDFTSTLKTKLDSVAAGAEVNVQSNWNEADATSDAYIQNKPTIPDDAADIDYDNSNSGLVATDVQGALDEIVASGGSDPNKMDKANPTGTGTFTMNTRVTSQGTGNYSFVAGDSNEASGDYSVAMGLHCAAFQDWANAGGYRCIASNYASHAEGSETIASGSHSHAEGSETTASGSHSHAEGSETTASGNHSHAEGSETTASEEDSHAEGHRTTASARHSHAEGYYTKASSYYQHVSGKYNVEDDQDTYAEIIGNGTADNARSNARTLDWSGNETLAGDLYFNGGANPLSTQLSNKADKPTLTHYASGNTSVSNATWTKLAQVSLTQGLYLVHVSAVFQGNAAGTRQLSFTSTATPGEDGRWNTIKIPAGTSAQVTPHMTLFVNVSSSSETWYLHGYQNAGTGTSLTVYPSYQYIKLK